MTVDLGVIAPSIDLLTHDGHRWQLSDQAGRPVVLIFHRHLH